LQITEIEVTKNYYPSDDTGIAAEDRYQQNLHILLITMAVSGLKSAQKQRLHNAKKNCHASTGGLTSSMLIKNFTSLNQI
jgi:hypothetical protein